MNKSLFSSQRMDWETPPDFFAQYNAQFHFTLDVCATAANTKCSTFFTPEQNGLIQTWTPNICWMNPPYGRAISAWMLKAVTEWKLGATVVCLVPSRTDTAWWHNYAMQGEITFLRGRIKFVGATHAAPFPCAVIVYKGAA